MDQVAHLVRQGRLVQPVFSVDLVTLEQLVSLVRRVRLA